MSEPSFVLRWLRRLWVDQLKGTFERPAISAARNQPGTLLVRLDAGHRNLVTAHSTAAVIATRVRHERAQEGEAFEITNGIGFTDPAHNLKVVGSNCAPQPNNAAA
jgi:hypothetical protein